MSHAYELLFKMLKDPSVIKDIKKLLASILETDRRRRLRLKNTFEENIF